ncbi:uncharacterized protein TRAVEDRAFT_76178, partial [Trametes versicolor FP-101664 SS1]|uniref:uncharacterized protein n=1 Tax=Trametes versicolor (strain FP-101664) TaxID=717944 RepID=UPI00046235D9
SVPKLASDGSNWVTYRERMKVVQTAKGHMPHICGTSRKPLLPPPINRDLPHITIQYTELVDKMELKYTLWETKEAGARALIYETLSDNLFIEVQSQPTTKALWEAVVASCENKSLMYANTIRTRIQNTRCPEGGDIRAHLALLLRERQNLAAVGTRLAEIEFAAIVMNSLLESYHGRVQTILDISSFSGQVIPVEFLINKLNKEFDRRAIIKANDIALTATSSIPSAPASALYSRQPVECYNCHGKGHIARNCRRKGGGREGQ